jgi:hypothetical protein
MFAAIFFSTLWAFCGFLHPTTQAHPMHLAVTEMNFNGATQSFEISHKIFYDDLEEAIFRQTKQKLQLNTPTEHPLAEKYIQTYLLNNFAVHCNQRKQTLSYVGREYENDAIWLHYEVSNVRNLQYLEIKNSLLLDTFDDQVNFLHFKKADFAKSWRFTLDQTLQQWEF